MHIYYQNFQHFIFIFPPARFEIIHVSDTNEGNESKHWKENFLKTSVVKFRPEQHLNINIGQDRTQNGVRPDPFHRQYLEVYWIFLEFQQNCSILLYSKIKKWFIVGTFFIFFLGWLTWMLLLNYIIEIPI